MPSTRAKKLKFMGPPKTNLLDCQLPTNTLTCPPTKSLNPFRKRQSQKNRVKCLNSKSPIKPAKDEHRLKTRVLTHHNPLRNNCHRTDSLSMKPDSLSTQPSKKGEVTTKSNTTHLTPDNELNPPLAYQSIPP